jgi:PAS domain S-box-containing protein
VGIIRKGDCEKMEKSLDWCIIRRTMDKNFRTMVECSIQGIVIIHDFRVVYSNQAFAKISGYSKKELLSLTPAKLEKVIHPDHRDLVWGRMGSRLQGQKVTPRYEFKGIRKDGSIRWLEMVADRIDFEGKPAILGAIIDITDRKNTEKALRESEEKYRAIFESFHDVYYRTDREGLVTIISPSVRNHAGWDPEDIIGHPVTDFYKDPSEREAFKEKLKESGVINDYELKLLAKDGRVIDVSVSSKIIIGKDGRSIGVEGVLRDITDRKRVEEQVKSSLKEKEVLLQEIHHRVKNNMQIISSLLNLQSRNISDKKAKDMFKMSRDRIRSMALIHEKLYQSKDLSKINFAQYIQSLTLHLLHTYNANAKRIKLNAEVKDVFLDINKAIPCGLIVNELVSNSLKHAFPLNMKGNILVQLSAGDNGNIRLSVSDDGIGFTEGVDIQKPDSLGLQLVNDLIHQLGGTLELDLSRGTSYQISFST